MTRYAPGVYEELKAQGLIDNAGYPTNLNLSNGLGRGTPRGGEMIPEQGPLTPSPTGLGPTPKPAIANVGGGRTFFSSSSTPMSMDQYGSTVKLAPGTSLESSYQGYLSNFNKSNTGGISGLMQTTQPTTTQQPSIPIQQQLGSSVGPIGGSIISSPYMDSNQDLDQYLNSYVDNLINRRMRDIFGGIMSIFQ